MNNNYKANIFTYIAVATLILLVGGATYAYFASTKNVNANIGVTANVSSGSYVFSAQSVGNIELVVTPSMMGKNNLGEVASDNASITVNLTSPDENTKTTCTYNIVWEWTTSDKYTTHTPGNNDNEFTIAVNQGLNETNLSNLTLNSNKITLVSGASIVSKGTLATVTHDVTTKIYNINAEQTSTLAGTTGKSFGANITIDENSINCTMVPYETTTVNMGTVAISESGTNQNISMTLENNTFAHKLLTDNNTTYSTTTNSGLVKDTIYGNMFRYQSNVDRTCSVVSDTCKNNSGTYFNTEDNTNNYVCFGYSNVSDCTGANKDDYLYRIIGIDKDTKEVQVIKATGIKEGPTTNFKYHNSTVDTDWGAGMTNPQADIAMRLNGTHTTLSNVFVNSTQYPYMAENSSWYNKISDHNWKSGTLAGNQSTTGCWTTLTCGTGLAAYNAEASLGTTPAMKIGLLNNSDVLWAFTGGSPGSYTVNRNSWLYSDVGANNIYEWAALRRSSNDAWLLYGNSSIVGFLSGGYVASAYRVRPSFYLISDILWTGGSGTKLDPFIVG